MDGMYIRLKFEDQSGEEVEEGTRKVEMCVIPSLGKAGQTTEQRERGGNLDCAEHIFKAISHPGAS